MQKKNIGQWTTTGLLSRALPKVPISKSLKPPIAACDIDVLE